MQIETVGRHLRVAGLGRVEQRVVDEDILVLGLDHVVALGTETRHVAVHVQRLLMLHAVQHRVNHDVRAGPTHAGATTACRIHTTT